ncbi:MAG: trigger factor [Planctomycetaceae bacterium]|nr:trigger factor [Planctomycetaceae bacterium]
MAEQENATVEIDGTTEKKDTLNYAVEVEVVGDCQRHVTVTIPVEDVQRYFRARYENLAPVAEIPGFRPGKAPRKLIESKFRKTVTEQVKGQLLLDTLTQIGDEQRFSAIGEPVFDFESVSVEEGAPLQFEFDIEVRPDFELPQWKGLELPQYVHEFTSAEIDSHAGRFLRRNSNLLPATDAVRAQDVVTLSIETSIDGEVVANLEELAIPVQASASFRDAQIDGFASLLVGKSINDEVTTTVEISGSASNPIARDKKANVKIKILDIKRYEDAELNETNVEKFGDRFSDVGEVRDAIKSELERRMAFEEDRLVRQAITASLTEAANWQLPPDLLERQSRRELERAVMELRRNGMSDEFINAYENKLRQNSNEQTATALREHFILERIAESEGIEDQPEDYDQEIELIALSMNDSARRVRSRLEKTGQLDALRNQIVERKVLTMIREHATFRQEQFTLPTDDVAPVREYLAGRGDAEIPVAKSDFVEPVNAMGKGEHVAPRTGR